MLAWPNPLVLADILVKPEPLAMLDALPEPIPLNTISSAPVCTVGVVGGVTNNTLVVSTWAVVEIGGIAN